MQREFMPGDKVYWFRMNRGLVSSTKIPAEVAYWKSAERIAIKVTGIDGVESFRYVPVSNLEKRVSDGSNSA